MARYPIFIVLIGLAVFGLMLAQPAAAQSVTFAEVVGAQSPWDSVPSPDGSMIYFTALGADGRPGVFSIPDGGGPVTTVAAGRPFAVPFGIAISTDGQTLFVTDPWAAGHNGNAVFAVSVSGDGVSPVAGTQGTSPQGIEAANINGVDQIVYSGANPDDGQPAIYMIGGNGPTIVTQGSPLVAPSGIAIGTDGSIYVLDRLASGGGLGSVFRIRNGSIETVASDVRTGAQLAGLTLTLDESLLLVSSLAAEQGTSQVLAIALDTNQTRIINDTIGVNTAAGGLHRAHNANIFAWIDNTGGGQDRGRIYCVKVGS
jgi:hypothetical protein